MAGRYRAYPEYKDSGVEWLGEVPEHWLIKKLKYQTNILPSNVDKKSKPGEDPIQLCNYTDVYYNDLIRPSRNFMKASATREQIIKFTLRACDTIITKDSEDINDIAVPAYVPETIKDVICGYHLALIRPFVLRYGAFIKRNFETSYAKAYFGTMANGLTRYGLGTYALANAFFVQPPLKEAVTIATFLNHETTKIDTLIEKQQKLIALLKEKRQAVISHAVTKGLNPDAPMKDSGVEWLGEVPAHWKILQIKHLSCVKRGASPRPIDDPKYFDEDGEYVWTRIADVTASDVYLTEASQRLSDLGSSLSVKLQPGSLFLSIAGTVGKPCITGIKTCIHDGFVYFPELKIPGKYLFYIFAAGQAFQGLGKFGTQLNLNTDTVGGIKVGIPETKEISQIITFIDYETAKIDNLINKANRSIELSKERRTALISAAVTGKIDVRDWQPPPPHKETE